MAGQIARGDATPPVGVKADPGWCFARYLKETARAAPKPAPAAAQRTTSFKIGGATVHLELPAALPASLIGADLIQIGGGAGVDEFPRWDATLQVRWQTHAELEARVNAIESDFMGKTRATIETRAGRWQGRPAEELCAIVRRTPGHATLTDGRHVPMPDSVELVHGFLVAVGEKTLGAAYRLPPGSLEQQPMWERILQAVPVEK
jgi:hypothetical protein